MKTRTYKAQITIETKFKAASLMDAKTKALNWQEQMAGSNTGSEKLANARVVIARDLKPCVI